MRGWPTLPAVPLTATLFLVSLCGAQPGGIGMPGQTAPALQAGDDSLTFSDAPITLVELVLVDRDSRPVARLPRGPAGLELCQGQWVNDNRGLALKGDSPGALRCRIPESAAGIELKYLMAGGRYEPVTLSLNGSSVSLAPIHQAPRQTILCLSRESGKVQLTGNPGYNLWDLQGTPPGPRQDEVHREIDSTGSYSPLRGNGYTVRVSFIAREDSIRSPQAGAYARLHGFDVTQYDGYIVTVKSPDAHYFSTSLSDSNGFGWSGAGMGLRPNEWTSLAVPFHLHRNYATAGDGVLKLSQLTSLTVNVGGRPGDASPVGKYWVRNPVFYKGDPPKGVTVADKPARGVCAVRSLSPKRRMPHCFEGIAVNTIAQQGDSVWLGTDRGLIKTSVSDPSLKLAEYTMSEGLVDDEVHTIHADGKYLWVGTTCGLSRFDGKEFRNYTSDDGLLPGPVMGLTSDDKYLWMAMARGIARLDKSGGEIVAQRGRGGWAPESTGGQGVPIQEGRGIFADSIALDSDGTVWHGAAGLWHSNAKGRQMRHYLGNTKRVLAVQPVEEGVWLVSAHGIELIEREEGLGLASYGIGNRRGIYGERHKAFVTCAYADRDVIWLGYSDGLGWFDPVSRRCNWSPYCSVALGSLVPQCLFSDEQRVWVGTDNGLLVFPRNLAPMPWTSLEYSAPADVWAAGVDMDPELVDCDDVGMFGQGAYSVTLDDEAGVKGSPGALMLAFNLSKDADSQAIMRQRFDMPLGGANALSFCAKTDKPVRQFFVDLRVDVKHKGATRSEVWRAQVDVTGQWKRFDVPFARMRLVSDNGRTRPAKIDSVHLTGVDFRRRVGDFQCPGDAGKLWVDQLAWRNLGRA